MSILSWCRLGPGGALHDELTLPLRWRSHDLGFYCNRALLHRASASTQKRDPSELRLMHRISVRGEGTPPFYLGKTAEERAATAAAELGADEELLVAA